MKTETKEVESWERSLTRKVFVRLVAEYKRRYEIAERALARADAREKRIAAGKSKRRHAGKRGAR